MRSLIFIMAIVLSLVACKQRTNSTDSSTKSRITTISDKMGTIVIKNGKRILTIELHDNIKAKEIFDAMTQTSEDDLYITEENGFKWQMYQVKNENSTESFHFSCASPLANGEHFCVLEVSKRNTNPNEKPMLQIKETDTEIVVTSNPEVEFELPGIFRSIFLPKEDGKISLPSYNNGEEQKFLIVADNKSFQISAKKYYTRVESQDIIVGSSKEEFVVTLNNSENACQIYNQMSDANIFKDNDGYFNKGLQLKADKNGKEQALSFSCYQNSADFKCGCGLSLAVVFGEEQDVFKSLKSKQSADDSIYVVLNDPRISNPIKPFFEIFKDYQLNEVTRESDQDTNLSLSEGVEFVVPGDRASKVPMKIVCRKNAWADKDHFCKIVVTISDEEE